MAGIVCAGLIAACGGDGGDGSAGQTGIRALVQDLQEAAKAGDSARICDELFTENLKASAARASGQSCADEVDKSIASPDAAFQIEELDVTGDRAKAQLVDQDGTRSDVVFERAGGDWRIARIAGVRSANP